MPKKKSKKAAIKKLQDITEKTNQLCLSDSSDDDDLNPHHDVSRLNSTRNTSDKWNVDKYMASLEPSRHSQQPLGPSPRSDLPSSRSHGHSGLQMTRSKIRLGPSKGRETITPDPEFINEDLSDEDTSNLKEIFSIFDTRACGSISFKDLMRALRFLRLDVKEPEVVEILKTLHCTSDVINAEVFMNVVVECEKRRVDWSEQILGVMDKIDVGGMGGISVEDLNLANDTYGLGFSQKDIKDMMLVADVGGDGLVDGQEFVGVMLQTNLFSR